MRIQKQQQKRMQKQFSNLEKINFFDKILIMFLGIRRDLSIKM